MNIKRLFTFDWFGSEERKEIKEKIKQLELENARLVEQKDLLEEFQKKINETKTPIKPYKNLYFTGTNVTVITETGMLQSECSLEQYELIKEAKTEEEIKSILYKKEEKEQEYVFQKDDLAILRVNNDFTVVDNRVYLNPVRLELPSIVTATFIEILEKKLANSSSFKGNDFDIDKNLDEQYESLKMFWFKLSTNSIEKCRESVLKFCKDNDVRISKLGNIIAYRNVVTYKTTKLNTKLQDFVNEEYYKITKKWKKKASDFNVFNDNGYILVKADKQNHGYNNFVGNLADLKAQGCDEVETIYTSWHNKGRYTFKIGDVYKMVDETINENVGNCNSQGLHGCSVKWDYSGFGDTKMVILINPSKTIFTPSSDSGKFRCSEMKIACLNPNDYGIHIDYELIRQADEEYNEYTIEQLQEIVKTKSFENISVGENLPLLNLQDIKDIAEILKQKIVKI